MVEESAGCTSPLALAALADVDVVYLTTIGRHSGLPRTIEIWFTYHAGKLFLNAERRHAAQWVQNVLHDPLVRVRLRQHEFAGQARILDLHSDSELWQTVVELSRRKYDWGEGLPVEITPL
jgi:deazaflavin-dependent oxidoreductase (nitroreductase family)